MVKLYDKGVYLVNGTEIIEDNQEAAAVLAAKTGTAVVREEAAAGTMAYNILKAHNTSDSKSIRTGKISDSVCTDKLP